MKKLLMIPALVALLASCGEANDVDDSDVTEPEEADVLVNVDDEVEEQRVVEGFLGPESVLLHEGYLYVSNVGQGPKPQATDGDGFISLMTQEGDVEEMHFLPADGGTLNGPKGSAVVDNVLYVADVDHLRGFDLETREQVFDLSFEGETTFLNDVVEGESNVLYVSATDANQLYRVDLEAQDYRPLALEAPLNGPNGLFYDEGESVLYVVTMGSDNMGRVGRIGLNEEPLQFVELAEIAGSLDGLQLRNDKLYFSNWGTDQIGYVTILEQDAEAREGARIITGISGPADFEMTEDGKSLFLPAMLENKVYILPVKEKNQ